MKQINIADIKLKSNIRVDYGDLTELTASIKENGVRQPLILDKGDILVDGHRRLKAAKAAGLEKVDDMIRRLSILQTA